MSKQLAECPNCGEEVRWLPLYSRYTCPYCGFSGGFATKDMDKATENWNQLCEHLAIGKQACEAAPEGRELDPVFDNTKCPPYIKNHLNMGVRVVIEPIPKPLESDDE